MADKISGIVISVRDYSENDSLIKIISPTLGINTYLARGSKKTKSSLKIATQLFTYGDFFGKYPKKNGLGYLNSAESASIFKNISLNIILNAYASHIAELLVAAFDENTNIDQWYLMFFQALKKIDIGLDPQIIANVFEIQLLGAFGVEPNLLSDPIDGQTEGEFDFSEQYNGILSKKHYQLDDHRLHADPKAIYYLRMFSRIKISQFNSIKISDNVKRSLQRVIDLIYDRQVGLKTRSRTFIEQMNSLQIKYPNSSSN
ncbi:DNA repair protein RecO [Oenococcus sp. UCMA 17063]|nr:DNA repair protein RecO [Oenococcus sp. UCMA 17063]